MEIKAQISTDTLEDIYELTYKYQMLKQETERGDYGLPSQLSDKAYIEFEKIKDRLGRLIDHGLKEIAYAYMNWVKEHIPDFQNFKSDIELELSQLSDDFVYNYISLEELGEKINDDDIVKKEVLDTIASEAPVEGNEDYASWVKSLQKAGLDEFIDIGQVHYDVKSIPTTSFGDLEQLITILSASDTDEEDIKSWIFSSLFDTLTLSKWIDDYTEERMDNYMTTTAISKVLPVAEQLKDYERLNLDDQITLFQLALTTAHNNGSMADYIVGTGEDFLFNKGGPGAAIEFLNKLSAGPKVEQWDNELSKLLGYEVGSRSAPKDEWYRFSKRIARVIKLLAKIVRD